MLIYNVPIDAICQIATDNHMVPHDVKRKGRAWQFSLRVQGGDWNDPRAFRPGGVGVDGHYRFYDCLFRQHPGATVVTCMARYEGRNDFIRQQG